MIATQSLPQTLPKWPTWPQVGNVDSILPSLRSVLMSQRWTVRGDAPGFYFTEQAETEWANFCGSRFAVMTTSGSGALECMLRAIIRTPQDEILVPAMGWYATAAAVERSGGKPVLVDVDLRTSCLSPVEASRHITKNTRAILTAHLHNGFSDLKALRTLCDEASLYLLEDASQAQGAIYDDTPCGHYAHLVCTSFNQEKLLPIGEGGAVMTNDEALYKKMYALRTDGYLPPSPPREWLPQGVQGQNLCPSELQAALFIEQLKLFKTLNPQRLRTYHALCEKLNAIEGVHCLATDSRVTQEYCYELGIVFSGHLLTQRTLQEIAEAVRSEIQVVLSRTDAPLRENPLFHAPLHERNFPNTKQLYTTMLILHHRYLLEPAITEFLPQALVRVCHA